MPRPCKRRRICAVPSCGHFGPKDTGSGMSQVITMTLDEFEKMPIVFIHYFKFKWLKNITRDRRELEAS